MALTSNRAAMKALGRNWKRLHKTGIHYLWLIFLLSYLGRALSPEMRGIDVVFSLVALAALGLRIAAWSKTRRT